MTRRDGWNGGGGGESGRQRWRGDGLRWYFVQRIRELRRELQRKRLDPRRLRALRDDLSGEVRMLRAELIQLHVPASHVGVVIKVLGQSKVLVKIHKGSKYGVDVEKNIDIANITPSTRVALRRCGYKLHLILPTNFDPLLKLMKVEKVPDSTHDMIGGSSPADQGIKEAVELPIMHPDLFESLGIAQPKGVLLYRPAGTGKTLLARAVAHHNDCTSIRVSGSLVQEYVGQGSRMERELFMMA